MNKSLTGDPAFMIAFIRAQAGLGRFLEAQASVRVIAAKQPQIVHDPEFDSAVDFIFERMKAAGVQAPK